VHLNQSKKQHPILICDEAQLLRHPALEQLPLLLNFDMDSAHYLTLLLVGEPLLRRTLSLQMHEPLRQRIAVQYHLDGLSREELDAYLAHQLKAAGVTQPLLDETARQALYQATKGILRKVNKLVMTPCGWRLPARPPRWTKPFCWTPPARLCYDQGPGGHGSLLGPTSGAAVARSTSLSGGTRLVARARHPVCGR
jgi:hypothetical protein